MEATPAPPVTRSGIPSRGGPTMQIIMNVEQSRRLARLAVRADQVMRRGLNRLGRGRISAGDFEFCAAQVNGKIGELERMLEDVLAAFVPGMAGKLGG